MTTVRSKRGPSTGHLDEACVEEDEMMRSDIFEVCVRPRPDPEDPRWWLAGSEDPRWWLAGFNDVSELLDPDWHDGWGPVRPRQHPLA